MEEAHTVRQRVLVQGVSVRQVAREMGISRNTVRRYVEGAEPGTRRAVERPAPVLEKVRSRMEAILAESPRWTTRKQRLTAFRLHEMLLEEGRAIGYTTVKTFVREWRRQRAEVFVPLEYRAGELAEVDFFEVIVDVDGVRRKAFKFLMRLMHSGCDFVFLYDRQDQVSFLDGHVRAFEHFGFVPRRILFDNLKAAVARILTGSQRELSRRFADLARHYLFEPCFARPYTGHDKGGVEARGKAIRLRHMVPIPAGPSLQALSGELQQRIDARHNTERLEADRAAALVLPERRFCAAAAHSVRVSRRALVCVEAAHYSVPCRWAGLDVTARVWPDSVEIVGPEGTARHPRQKRGGRCVDYRHFLPELARKPNAVRQVAHRLVHDMGEPWPTVWSRLVSSFGELQASRLFAELLRGVEQLGAVVMAERLAPILSRNEPPLLALVRSELPGTLAADSIPESLRGVIVERASAASFDALIGGAL
ncbi:MAG: IS21 family transposase [Bryobacteraceae bacterium]|nr:IS21 family transposase [Bryobacteraceae bacterium]